MSAIIYLLQVSACIALFYGFYYFMLNRLTFFTINRYYLLFTLLISFIIPLLTIHLHQPDNYPRMVQQVVYANILQNMPLHTEMIVPAYPAHKITAASSINWPYLLKIVYLLAVITLFVHLLLTLINFFAKLKDGKTDRIGRVNVMHGNKSLTNGSFLNYIFLNDDKLSPDELQQVIAHEMLHVKLLHSIDRIVAKIIQIILWFNPFIYLYVRSIEENHEFEVDREIARSTDKNNYAELLLHLSIARGGMLYHSFSKVPLKKRIAMLFNKPSANVKRVIYVLVIPVVLISCLAFARLKSDDKKASLFQKTGEKNSVMPANVKTQQTPPTVRPTPPSPVKFPPPIPKPNSGARNYMSKVNLALLHLWANDVAGAEKCLDSIKDKNSLLLALNEVAWQLALESRNLDYAEKISKQSVGIINDQLKHPVAGSFGTVDQTRKELNHDIFMVGDTYGYVLYKEGKYAEALKVLQPLYDRLPKKEAIGIPPHYAEALAASNNYIKAKEVAEQWIKFGNITVEPTLERELENNALRASYIKTNGTDKGYNEYLAGLKKANVGARGIIDAVSFPTDMVEFYAQPYNRQLKPNARLGDLLKLLPGIKVDNKNTLFFEGQLIDKITIRAPGAASSIRSQEIMANLPADRVMFLRIMNNHSKDPNKKPSMNIFVNLIKAD